MSSTRKQSMLEKINQKAKMFGVAPYIRERVSRKLGKTSPNFKICAPLVRDKAGLEIGGPSKLFSRGDRFPVYPIVGRLDNCNFSDKTIWEGTIQEGQTYTYDKQRPNGFQYIREAVDLNGIVSDSYDFVLSSHALEHVANPLRALKEWLRVLRQGGVLVLILPHKDGTFDHRRPPTPLAHLIEDFERGTKEDDLTHLPEILELHDLALDPDAGTLEQFRKRSMDNFAHRGLHQHVFTTESVAKILDFLSVQIIQIDPVLFFDIISISRKLPSDQKPDNSAFLGKDARYRLHSPFASDHK